MAREESARNRCVVRSQEATEMCESRALRNFQNCEAAQKWLLAHDGPVALVTGNAHASGSVAVGYTGLEIAGDLAGLKGLMVVEPNVDISGALNFTPFDGLGRLGDCIGDWDGPFHARLDQQQSPKRLAGALSVNDDGLMTHWPGLTVPMNMSQGPLEALLTAEPGRLSACGLGITAAEVGARATGEDGFYLRGVLPMDVQPGVTHIEMPPISLKLGERETGAIGEWGAQVLRFELQ